MKNYGTYQTNDWGPHAFALRSGSELRPSNWRNHQIISRPAQDQDTAETCLRTSSCHQASDGYFDRIKSWKWEKAVRFTNFFSEGILIFISDIWHILHKKDEVVWYVEHRWWVIWLDMLFIFFVLLVLIKYINCQVKTISCDCTSYLWTLSLIIFHLYPCHSFQIQHQSETEFTLHLVCLKYGWRCIVVKNSWKVSHKGIQSNKISLKMVILYFPGSM